MIETPLDEALMLEELYLGRDLSPREFARFERAFNEREETS